MAFWARAVVHEREGYSRVREILSPGSRTISWDRGGVDGCEIWVGDWTLFDGATCDGMCSLRDGVTLDGAYSLLDAAERSRAETESSGLRAADVKFSANALGSGATPWVADPMEAAGRDYMEVPLRGRED